MTAKASDLKREDRKERNELLKYRSAAVLLAQHEHRDDPAIIKAKADLAISEDEIKGIKEDMQKAQSKRTRAGNALVEASEKYIPEDLRDLA